MGMQNSPDFYMTQKKSIAKSQHLRLRLEEMMTRLSIVSSTEGKEFEGKKESAIDSLNAELTAVFQVTAERNEKDTSFYATYFACQTFCRKRK